MDEEGLTELLELQDGVIARRQALELGCTPNDIRRKLRRREWVRVHSGVYVDHSGPLTWQQRAWSSVLLAWPAALCHSTAIRAADGPGRRSFDESEPLHVAVDRSRSFEADPAVILTHHLVDLDEKVNWNLRPPRVRIEHAVLDLAAEAEDEFAAIEVLAQAVQSRRTTAPRIRAVLDRRARIARREFLGSVLSDIADGTCSVLEQGYLTLVERPHCLPIAHRQLGGSARGPVYRDVTYVAQSLVVELDGRLFHDTATARDKDMDRDLDAAVDGLRTIRLGWGQVYRRPCLTAERIGRLLQQHGWEGGPRHCPSCEQRSARVSPGDTDPERSHDAGVPGYRLRMTENSESRPRGVEPPELHPGGADSIDDPEKYGDTPGPPTTRDLQPEDNPAVDDVLPDEVAEPDDKSQEPETGTSGEDAADDEPSG